MPSSLLRPIRYFLENPSKKIRPLLTLYSCRAFGRELDYAIPAAAAVELFHDFTLIHDDIMDKDELRRGKPTIHVKWDNGTAIMAGDALIGLSFQQLTKSPPENLISVVKIFSEALVKVCEGQAMDKAFETAENITIAEYMEMIGKKTAWLFKASCEIGAVIGGGSNAEIELLSEFGNTLGLAFQIQDDLLDFVADESKFGKKIGSDFQMDKKTYVTLKYKEMLNMNSQSEKYSRGQGEKLNSLEEFSKRISDLGVVTEVEKYADNLFKKSFDILENLKVDHKSDLYSIAKSLEHRQF
jgi:geranylgeranyl pyrophosphate synthase